jgi:D-cysteine desulfhydrase family pyridoxal phosphate-dependent enzyme
VTIQQAEIAAFRSLPKISFLPGPTPIERCERLRAAIAESPNIFIKRDDYTSYLIGGNKIRKLEYSLAEAVQAKATAVITIGSNRSNHARITAMAARRLGLKCHLVLNGNPGGEPSGNLLLTKLLDVRIIPVAGREDRLPKMKEAAEALRAQGEIVYEIPLGASDEVGSFGLTAAFEEIIGQEAELGVRFDTILLASSSSGTQAGLEIGKRLFGRPDLRIIGISPDDPAADIASKVVEVAERMAARIGMRDTDGLAEGVRVDEAYIGPGYGLATPASIEASALFAGIEGVLLDPVYTTKAAAALIDYCRKRLFRREENVLFWHTGGLIGLFG